MNDSETHRFSDKYSDLFSYIICLHLLKSNGQLDGNSIAANKSIIEAKVENFFKSVEASKPNEITSEDILAAKFAVVALIDEVLGWGGVLQLQNFGVNTAGQEFFNKLEKMIGSVRYQSVLEIYYLCLALGFKGKYAILGKNEIQAYLTKLNEELKLEKIETLSPNGAIPKEDVKNPLGIPWWAIAIVIYGCFLGLYFSLDGLKSRMISLAGSVVKYFLQL